MLRETAERPADPPEPDLAALATEILAALNAAPLYFAEIAERFAASGFAGVSRALGRLHAAGQLGQDTVGRYCPAGSGSASSGPESSPRAARPA